MIPQHQWINKFFGFDFVVEYRLRCLNIMEDALSRRDADGGTLEVLSVHTFTLFDNICKEVTEDANSGCVRDQVLAGALPAPWHVHDSLIHHGNRVFLTTTSPLPQTVLQLVHDAGHKDI